MELSATTNAGAIVRPLAPADLDAVCALDQRIGKRSRRGYFERRLASARRQPDRHLQVAVAGPAGLVGFLLARRSGGEYGRSEPGVVLETIGVEPSLQHAGLGRRMLAALEERSVGCVSTQVAWRDTAMLHFLDGAGFELAPRHVLQRPVRRMSLGATEDEPDARTPVVRRLGAGDLDHLQRIDRKITGLDRSDYLRRKVEEVSADSAIDVSLVAEEDGQPVAFAMARVDFGDFGRIEPTASLDTIGVHPSFTRRGLARALLGQMIDNLTMIDVERLETEVAREDFSLLRFLYRFGFGVAPRLAFERRITRGGG